MRYFGYILQTTSGARYVGISNQPKRRLREHRNAGPMAGLDFDCVEGYLFSTRGEAAVWEIETIAKEENLLNTSAGGWGGKKMRCSEEQKTVLSQKAKGRYADPKYRKRMGEAVRKAYREDPQKRENLSKAVSAACARPEVKARRGAAQKETWGDETVRQKRVAAIKAAASTPAARARRSEYKRQWWAGKRAEARL